MESTLLNLKFARIICSLSVVIFVFASCDDDDDEAKTAPAVTTAAVTEITSTTAMAGGEITDDGNAEITASGLVYSDIVSEPTLANDKVELGVTTGSFTAQLENLTPSKTYHVRAYATNSIGTSYGDVVDFTTGNATPTATNVIVSGDLVVGEELTAQYTYNDAEGDAESGTTFKWYMANDGAGAGETVINGATSNKYTIPEEASGKYIRVGVTPKAATGNTSGTEVKSAYVGGVGDATTVTFEYNGAMVTYGILTSEVTGKKWLDRNLGAPEAPTAYNDFANYGDLFQWGRSADGHQLIIRNGPTDADMSAVNSTSTTLATTDIPHDDFIINGTEIPFDWRATQKNEAWQGVNGINNPCPTGWRIPTQEEWTAENLGSLTDAYTKLKITLTGIRTADAAAFLQSEINGRYWTSTISGTDASRVSINSTSMVVTATVRANGNACRCIKD